MARACLKVYIDEKCVRTFGGNKQQVVKEVANIKKSTTEELKKIYPSINNSFRYSIIKVKRRNKVYRLYEIQDDLSEMKLNELFSTRATALESLTKDAIHMDKKLNVEIKFDQGTIVGDYSKVDLIAGFVRREVIDKLGKEIVFTKLLDKYMEVL